MVLQSTTVQYYYYSLRQLTYFILPNIQMVKDQDQVENTFCNVCDKTNTSDHVCIKTCQHQCNITGTYTFTTVNIWALNGSASRQSALSF